MIMLTNRRNNYTSNAIGQGRRDKKNLVCGWSTDGAVGGNMNSSFIGTGGNTAYMCGYINRFCSIALALLTDQDLVFFNGLQL